MAYHVVLQVFSIFQFHRVDLTGLVALADLEERQEVLTRGAGGVERLPQEGGPPGGSFHKGCGTATGMGKYS